MATDNGEALAVRAVSALYEAALDSSAWNHALVAVRIFMNGSHPGFAFRPVEAVHFDAFCPETDPYWHQAIADRFDADNLPWREQQKRPAGSAFIDRQLVDAETLRRSVFYNEITLPQNYHSTIHVNLVSGPSCGAYFSLGRACGQPAFDLADLDRFRLIMPAFTRAAQVLVGCEAAESAPDGDIAALSRAAVFCVTREGTVLQASEAAWRLAVAPDRVLQVTRGRLRLVDDRADRRLKRAVHDASAADLLGDDARGDDVAVAYEDGRLAGVLTVTPHLSRAFPGRRMAAVRWRTLAADLDESLAARLRPLFGLTGRETELAVMLGSACSLRKAAEALSMSFNTARCHLQRIMEKTGTRNQNELIRLLMRLDA